MYLIFRKKMFFCFAAFLCRIRNRFKFFLIVAYSYTYSYILVHTRTYSYILVPNDNKMSKLNTLTTNLENYVSVSGVADHRWS